MFERISFGCVLDSLHLIIFEKDFVGLCLESLHLTFFVLKVFSWQYFEGSNFVCFWYFGIFAWLLVVRFC